MTTSPVAFIRQLTDDRPEMAWLTGAVDATPEASVIPAEGQTIGEIVFPHLTKNQLTEFNRTAVGLLCLYWAYLGDTHSYESFTACQT